MEALLKSIDKLKALVIEYKNSIDYSKCKYHLLKDSISDGVSGAAQMYFFVHIESKKIVVNGNIQRVRSYMNIRNINVRDIFMDDDVAAKFFFGALKGDFHQACPVCKSTSIRRDFDFNDMRSCASCGSDWPKDGEIILDSREV